MTAYYCRNRKKSCVFVWWLNNRAYIWDMNNAQNTATMNASIQLQHIGRVEATPAGNLKQGMRLMWNFGEMSDVVSIDRETAKSI